MIKADVAATERYYAVQAQYRGAFNLFQNGNEMYHLDPLTHKDGQFPVCKKCKKAFDAQTIPKYCFKSGFDMGNGRRLGLPELKILERAMVSRVRHFNTIAKFKGFSMDGDKISGHFISFPHDGVKVLQKLPRNDIREK